MWARIVECMLGVWLLLSPFIFRHASDATSRWAVDISFGSTLIVLSLASYWRPTRGAHWLLFPVGALLVALGRWGQPPPLVGGLQNEIVVGLLLLMLALIPNNASQPPPGWRRQGQA